MSDVHRGGRMPLTLRVAFTVLWGVTAVAGGVLLPIAFFMGVWGSWLGLLVLALPIAYATVTVLVMRRKRWAKYATPLFPVSLSIAAAMTAVREPVFPALIAAAVLTLVAVGLIFAPPSRGYFTRRIHVR